MSTAETMRIRATERPITIKPWGREILLEHNARYALKEILMQAGTRCSLQSHLQKVETIVIISGKIELEIVAPDGATTVALFEPGDAYSIPAGTKHRVRVMEDCRLIEASSPELDDVIRHADDYDRADKSA